MVRNTLFLKSIRDMKHALAQFVSIFLMCMIAMMVLSGLDVIWKTVEVHSDRMYEATATSDLWAVVKNPSDRDLWKVRRISGVASAQRQFAGTYDVDLPGNPSLKIYAAPEIQDQNLPYTQEGTLKTPRGAVLDQNFAKANGLQIGDRIRIEVNDQWLEYVIEALALSSEHVFAVKDTASLLPDAQKYGFIMVKEETISKAFGGRSVYNQMAISLEQDADLHAVEQQLEVIFGKELIGIITHQDHGSINFVEAKIDQFQTLAKVFASMFFIVAALITLSTMVRLVEDQRNQVGLLKALGYRKEMILWHYTSYGVLVGLLGALCGMVVGPNLIGRMMLSKLSFLFVLPDYGLRLSWSNILICSLLIILCTGGISCYSCLRLLQEKPADLLRVKPPKKAVRVWLEAFPRHWDHLKLQNKLVMRNIAKNKMRMCMSILGVMGCMALILGALTLKSMLGSVSERLFTDIYQYDQRITLADKVSHRFVASLSLDGIQQDLMEHPLQLKTAQGEQKMSRVTVLRDQGALVRLLKQNGRAVDLPTEGILITRKLAETLGVGPGDLLTVKLEGKKEQAVEIKDTFYLASGQTIYMRKEVWEGLGGTYRPSALLVKWNEEGNRSFLESSRVSSVIDREQQKANFEANLSSVNFSAVLMIIFGSSLAFVVIYNMSLLNFHERLRDLSTLKVLGFYQKEIQNLVLAENILSVIGGIVLGIPAGKVLSMVMAVGFGEDFDLIPHLVPGNILIAIVLNLVFMVAVNCKVAKKMNEIDMLDALKSVE